MQETAAEIAERLVGHPAVENVRYPGLPGQDPQGLVGRQMEGPGAILSFTARGGRAAAAQVLEKVRLLTPAVSLGSTDSLIQAPACLTHRLVDEEALIKEGVEPGMLRISVGLEDVDDLWGDLSAALDATVDRRMPRFTGARLGGVA
jgi:cystathionine beta-lyase/cystathionine gamma-synthase